MKTIVAAGFVLAFGLTACGKKELPAPPPPKPMASAVSVEGQPDAAPPPPTPAQGTDDAPGDPSITPAEHELSLKELTAAVQTYMQVNPEYPKDLNDLVKMKLLKKMPTPPPGKKFVIDRANICVILVDK